MGWVPLKALKKGFPEDVLSNDINKYYVIHNILIDILILICSGLTGESERERERRERGMHKDEKCNQDNQDLGEIRTTRIYAIL